MIVYMATNRINGKEYIGQTVGSLHQRKNGHFRRGHYFHKALCKYGKENFDWEILYRCDNIDDLNRLEIYYIKLYRTFENGYNLTRGGEGTFGFNAQCAGELNPNYRGAITGRKEVRDKISNTLKKNGNSKGKNNPMYGVHRYNEHAAHAHPVMVEGVRYHTKKQAAERTDISLYLINKLINKGEVVLL